MRSESSDAGRGSRWIWAVAYVALALYTASRLEVFALSAEVATSSGIVRLPNTFASVDHPFHVARAETLWRALASGDVLRWVGQHQGGYPVEFYPLGEAWLEILIRGASLGGLSAHGAHTIAVTGIFLAPGLAFAALAQCDGCSPAVGFLALVLHIALPGSWYHGGYTELVQWGLVTNVAGAVAALLMLPALLRFLKWGGPWSGALASGLATWALYCNPRAAIGLGVLAIGAAAAVLFRRPVGNDTPPGAPPGGRRFARARTQKGQDDDAPSANIVLLRVLTVGPITALLAAPLLVPLIRFRDLYHFVHYGGYGAINDYLTASAEAVSWPVLGLGVLGLGMGLRWRRRLATTAVAVSLTSYALVTTVVAFFPWASRIAPQLEPTRLMPLQRYLVLYLAAAATWLIFDRLVRRFSGDSATWAAAAVGGFAVAIAAILTRPLPDPPDPASPLVPPASLYRVAMSAQSQQFDLEMAVRAADEAAEPGTALVVVGSALSWHQQLWAPLWTERPLYFDNWLWYWHADHAGTPGYRFLAGHHYPDPDAMTEPGYLARHGIGGVVVTGHPRDAAASPTRQGLLSAGVYDAYAVLDPVTTATFGDHNAAQIEYRNQSLRAEAEAPGAPIVARINWHPRWAAMADERAVSPREMEGGYLSLDPGDPSQSLELAYAVQPWDWTARVAALAGMAAVVWMVRRRAAPGL